MDEYTLFNDSSLTGTWRTRIQKAGFPAQDFYGTASCSAEQYRDFTWFVSLVELWRFSVSCAFLLEGADADILTTSTPQARDVLSTQEALRRGPCGSPLLSSQLTMLQYLRRRPKRPRIVLGRTDPIDVSDREQLPPRKSEARMLSESQNSFEPSSTPEADSISSVAIGRSRRGYSPDLHPRCMICRDLDAAALPIIINLKRLKTLLRGCCPACNMLHSVLQPWRERIEKSGLFQVEVDDSTVGIVVYASGFVGDVSQIRLFAIDGKWILVATSLL